MLSLSLLRYFLPPFQQAPKRSAPCKRAALLRVIHPKQAHVNDLHVPVPQTPYVLVVARHLQIEHALRHALHKHLHLLPRPAVLLPRFDQPFRQLNEQQAQLARTMQIARDHNDRPVVRAEVVLHLLFATRDLPLLSMC